MSLPSFHAISSFSFGRHLLMVVSITGFKVVITRPSLFSVG
jgi:hypothetical protein